MPIQILPRVPGFGEQLGAGLGTGLGRGMEALTREKLRQLTQQQQMAPLISAIQQMYGIEPTAAAVSPVEAVIPPTEAVAPVEPKVAPPTIFPRDEKTLFEQLGYKKPYLLEKIERLVPPTAAPTREEEPTFPLEEVVMPSPSKIVERIGLIPTPLPEREKVVPPARRPLSEIERSQLLASGATGDLRQVTQTMRNIEQSRKKEAQFERKLELEREKEERKERIEAFKLTKGERKEILEKAKSARQNLLDLERMEELQEEGKLDTPGYVEFLKRSGLDIPALMSPGSEEFQKIAVTFLRDARTYFGARVTNFELDQFLKGIPSLSQSPEGRKRVIANLKRFNRIALEHSNALKEVIAENKGTPPLDLLEKIDTKVGKKMDKLAELFKEDLKKPVPKGQSKLIAALQAAAGGIIGAPGKLLGKIGAIGGGAAEVL